MSSSSVGYEAFPQNSMRCFILSPSQTRRRGVPCCLAHIFFLVWPYGSLQTFGTKLPLDVRPDLGHSSPLAFVTGWHFLVEPYPGSGVEWLLSCHVEHRSLICILNLSGAPDSHGAQPSAGHSRSTRAERVECRVSLHVLGLGLLKQSVSVSVAQWESSPHHLLVCWPLLPAVQPGNILVSLYRTAGTAWIPLIHLPFSL